MSQTMTVTVKIKSQEEPIVHELVQSIGFENNSEVYWVFIGETRVTHRYPVRNIEYITEDRGINR